LHGTDGAADTDGVVAAEVQAVRMNATASARQILMPIPPETPPSRRQTLQPDGSLNGR
jgi:hypothetical protein